MYIETLPSRDEMSYDVQGPLVFVAEDGDMYRIKTWSLDSIVRPRSLRRRAVEGQLGLSFQGFGVSIPVRMVPGQDHRRLYFTGLNSRQNELLRQFYHGIVSGQMATVGGVLHSMDMPVRDVPMHETEEELAQAPRPVGRWWRALMALTLYLLLAAVVFGALGYSAWNRWNFVDMANSRFVSADQGLAVQGWLHDDDVTDTWIGMPADVRLNVDGNVVSVDGQVIRMTAGSEAGFDAKEGYLVQVLVDDASLEGATVATGTPADVVLDRQLLTKYLP